MGGRQMNDTNSHVYLVMQYDASMGKEWVMFAYDTPWEAENQAKLIEMESKGLTQYFVKSVRYFRKESVHG
jgi:hypothetical protein